VTVSVGRVDIAEEKRRAFMEVIPDTEVVLCKAGSESERLRMETT